MVKPSFKPLNSNSILAPHLYSKQITKQVMSSRSSLTLIGVSEKKLTTTQSLSIPPRLLRLKTIKEKQTCFIWTDKSHLAEVAGLSEELI
jgi:hypothetical protein